MKKIRIFRIGGRWFPAAEQIVAVVAICLAAGLGSGCQQKKKEAPPPPTVEVVPVTQKDVPVRKEWVGSLDGSVNAVIRPQVTGYLIKQNYHEGQFVKKGQTLFLIDPRTFKAALDQAQAQLAQQQARHDTAKANLARIKPLAEQNAVSRKDLDDATGMELSTRSSVEAARAAVEEARLNLGFTKITSPVDGIPGIAKAQLGDLVSPDMPNELTSVSTVNPIKAYISVSEREYLKVRGRRTRIRRRYRWSWSWPTAASIPTKGTWFWPTARSTPPPARSGWDRSSPTPATGCVPGAMPWCGPSCQSGRERC